MTIIYRYQFELHDSLYYATREIGRLYETEPVLHNYALCYALGLVDNDTVGTTVSPEFSYRYFCGEQIPLYKEHLTPLNNQGIYVTPAKAVYYTTNLHTWKYADNNYHVEMEKTAKNIPSYGRNKEIAPESVFEGFIISKIPLQLPRWIRLGKWMSKAKITEITPLENPKKSTDLFTVSFPLNPLDVMFTNQVISYDVINMPPVSLIRNVTMRGDCYLFEKSKIPINMEFRFNF